MLYIFSSFNDANDDFLKQVMPLLTEERLAKVTRIRDRQGKLLSAAVYLLLRFALRDEFGIAEAVEFIYGEKGKPELRDHPEIRFNLSHCRNAAACVVSNRETGVDIQDIRTVSERVAKRVLTADEFMEFKGAEDPDGYFCRLWAIKECRLKQTGRGIGVEMSQLPADSVADIYVHRGDDYFCCVSGAETVIRHISCRELLSLLP